MQILVSYAEPNQMFVSWPVDFFCFVRKYVTLFFVPVLCVKIVPKMILYCHIATLSSREEESVKIGLALLCGKLSSISDCKVL